MSPFVEVTGVRSAWFSVIAPPSVAAEVLVARRPDPGCHAERARLLGATARSVALLPMTTIANLRESPGLRSPIGRSLVGTALAGAPPSLDHGPVRSLGVIGAVLPPIPPSNNRNDSLNSSHQTRALTRFFP